MEPRPPAAGAAPSRRRADGSVPLLRARLPRPPVACVGRAASGLLAMSADFAPMCGQCPFRPDAPRGVWHPSEYIGLVFGFRSRPFYCHLGRRGPDCDRRPCGGWQRAHADDPSVIGDAGAVFVANAPAFAALDAGEGCRGAGLASDGNALAARCPVCGLLLQADGEIPRHLPPGHPAGGARNGVAT